MYFEINLSGLLLAYYKRARSLTNRREMMAEECRPCAAASLEVSEVDTTFILTAFGSVEILPF